MTDQPATDGLMPFHAMEILKRAKAIEATGRTVCHLEVGEPGSPPAPRVIEAVRQALPQAQGYTNAKGLTELRDGLATYYASQHGLAVDSDSILCTMGSSAGFIIAFHTAFRPGAKIAITRPGYPAYVNTLLGLGFGMVEILVEAANGWHLTGADIAAAHAAEPFDGLLFASPANPTGASVDKAGLADIVATCQRLGVRLISDEIYHGLDYRGPSVSALELTRDAIVINSFSKYYCMTGWRIGWMVLPDDLVRRAEILQQNLFISAPTLSQIAATAALGERDYAEEQKALYAINRGLLNDGLRGLGFDIGNPSDGAFYAYAGISRFSNDSMHFCETLLDEAGVAATPGTDFDRTNGGLYVRFSYAGRRDTMEQALERMAGFLR
ncbi:pyridoxal phosphate-dependent aminotransferase [Devosia ginsengisoli]|uniref:pyridoxal phosphate-dependent aminotransferase n=1 Tax=Devosia ginsengisoli TaxID=400770 RepID=UPI0026EAA729|nr:aminotransferase class I/II-fold pyridoxal phosphate-dependent enzyme [Devosia ginsengisoli]MCR6672692.1 aminotransferase class I/II-fold pyridoxal phosphate-dependent enzyme [Devosia ginsengisoli]